VKNQMISVERVLEFGSLAPEAPLHEAVTELPQGYDSLVAEGGSNFSLGQRQLLCLARANLKRNRILVLDEAISSVDRHTDRLLHEALNKAFKDATIVKIAHWLDTIIEDDYILVLGSGKLLEFSSPAELICSGGAFKKMVKDTGGSMAAELKKRAYAAETRSC
jgi:ATP-binding cassette subfamily C (CFTR/MRP) protein 4